jgi:hypothetical protein
MDPLHDFHGVAASRHFVPKKSARYVKLSLNAGSTRHHEAQLYTAQSR